MDEVLHTLLAVGSLMGAFYIGKHVGGIGVPDKIVTFLLERLEADGYISTKIDEDGEKELVPISTEVANALREASKISSKT